MRILRSLDNISIPALETLFFLFLLSTPLVEVARAEAEKPPAGPDLRITAGGAASAAVEGGDGEFSGTYAKAAATYRDFSLSYTRLDYSWGEIGDLPFGNGVDDPWEALHVLSLGYSHRGSINADWNYFIGSAVKSSFEEELEDSYGAGAFGGFTYLFSPTLRFTIGAGVAYHHISTTVLPVVGISWNQGTPQGFSIALGYPDTYLSYRFNSQWALRSRIVQFEQDVFRLADDSTVEKAGFLERQDLITDLGVEFTPTKQLRVILAARYYFERELTIHDNNDDWERTFDVDDAWGGVLSVNYRF